MEDDTELEEMFFHKYGNTTRSNMDAMKKRIDEWTVDILTDQDKMDAWVEERKTLNKLDENGLLAKKERNRIIAEVNKKKRLDELFGVK